MIRASRIVSAVMVFLWVLPGMVWGVDTEENRETLRGIKGVTVAIVPVEPEVENAGLTQGQIRKDVELKLRMAGLNVLTTEKKNKEMLEASGGAFLFIVPTIIKHPKLSSYLQVDMYVYNIHLELNQGVYLMRNKKFTAGSTWSTWMVGVTGNLDDIRIDTKDLVDKFLNAWRSVNPK